jgi:hypothetical protein
MILKVRQQPWSLGENFGQTDITTKASTKMGFD